MINSGSGGTLYLGVTDDGRAEGFMMSIYQKDHFRLEVADLCSRYNPKIPSHLVSISFVPVLDDDESEAEAVAETATAKGDKILARQGRDLGHEVRESRYCWCDTFTLAASAHGLIHRFYIIEVKIAAWDKSDRRNESVLAEAKHVCCDGRPLFANESGNIYMRRPGYTFKIKDGKSLDLVKSQRPSPLAANTDLSNIMRHALVNDKDDEEEFFSYSD